MTKGKEGGLAPALLTAHCFPPSAFCLLPSAFRFLPFGFNSKLETLNSKLISVETDKRQLISMTALSSSFLIMRSVSASRNGHTDTTDATDGQGDARYDLAEVLHAAGRTDESIATYNDALERYESKRNLAQAGQVRNRVLELQSATRATPHP